MNFEEEIAEKHLRAQGFTDIVYEPDGNVPPDFVVEGKTAVEVRRLNHQKVGSSGEIVGIEADQFTALRVVKSVLSSRRMSEAAQKWWVSYRLVGVLPPAKELKKELNRALDLFENQDRGVNELKVFERFTISLFPRGEDAGPTFKLAGYSDRNAGGWLTTELQRNLQFCISEKAGKIAAHRSRYRDWWLLLVDYVGYGQLEDIRIDHDWDRVVVIDPRDHLHAYIL